MGELSNKFGDMVEHLIGPNLVEKFNALGYEFTKASRRVKFIDIKNDIRTEVDFLLENGDCAVVIETKATPRNSDITDHLERLEKVRRYADLHNDKRAFYGAIAGAMVNEDAKRFALKNDFYVIEQSGDTVRIECPAGHPHPNGINA
jgi:hypothetical protein